MKNSIDPRTVLSYSLTKPPAAERKEKDLEAIRETSREFETLFVMEMYKAMRKAVPEGGLFEKSMATDMYQEMLDMEIARNTASGKGIGIAEAMYRQLAEVVENTKYEDNEG